MNREESIKLLAIIKVAYPSSYKDMDKTSAEATVNMWCTSFPDVPYVIMEMAFNNFRMNSKFPPTVADMCDELRNIYWVALGDRLDPYKSKDKTVRCEYILAHTERFKSQQRVNINYNSIPSIELKAYECKLLTEG